MPLVTTTIEPSEREAAEPTGRPTLRLPAAPPLHRHAALSMRARWLTALALVAATATAAGFFLAHALATAAPRRPASALAPAAAALRYRHPLGDATALSSARRQLDDQIAGLQERARTVAPSPFDDAELADLYFRRGKLTAAPADFARAEELARRSLAALPTDNSAVLVLAKLDNAHHRFAEAIALASKAGRKPGALSALATAYLATGALPAAASAAETLVQAQPTSASLLLRALVMAAQGRDEEAASDFSRAALAEEAGDLQEAARLRALWARFLLRRGELDGAERLVDEALRIAPGDPLTLAQRGEVLLRRGQARRAAAVFESAFASSRQVRYLLDQARAEAAAGDAANAAALRAQVERLVRADLADDAGGTGHRLDLVEVLIDSAPVGPAAPASPALAEAVSLARLEVGHRPSAETHYQLARALARSGNLLESLEHIQAALATGAREPQFYELAARLEQRRHNTARAALYGRLARDLDPQGAGWRTAGMEMP